MAKFTIDDAPATSPQGNSSKFTIDDAGPAAPQSNTSWGRAFRTGVGNIIPSAEGFAKGVYQTVRHPIDTAEAISSMGRGAGQELAEKALGRTPEKITPQEQSFEQLKHHFSDRYGSVEKFKQAVAKDPVGVATDIASALEPAKLATDVPGVMGKVAKVASKASDITNPAYVAQKIGEGAIAANKYMKNPTGKVISHALGLTTGVGAKPLQLAYEAGKVGGTASQKFLDNMRGNVPLNDVIDSAKGAVAQLRSERGANYRSGMYDISKDKTVLSFDPITKALSDAKKVKSFKGKDVSPSTTAIWERLDKAVDDWKTMDPKEYHTPEGMDALKQLLGDIRADTKYGTPERVVANKAYNAVKDEIVKQAPTYARVMRDYESASNVLQEMQDTLSLKEGAKPDTALRKLQSIMRDNVQTNYGRRGELAKMLSKHGAPDLEHELAGQSLSPLAPRGIARAGAGIEALSAMAHPWNALALIPASPRLMGEAAHGLGAGARLAGTPQAQMAGRVIRGAAPYAYETGTAKNVMDQITGGSN